MTQYEVKIRVTVLDEAAVIEAAEARARLLLMDSGHEISCIEDAINWLVTPDVHPAGLEIGECAVELVAGARA